MQPEQNRLYSVISWITTIPFLVCFIGTLVIFDPIHRLAYFFGSGLLRKSIVAMNSLILFWLRLWCGTRFTVQGLEHLKSVQQAIIVANHESMFDIPLILWFLRRLSPQFIAKQELGKYLPSISFLLRNMGSLMINRSDQGGALASIRNYGIKSNENGQSVAIFPEGTRARDGAMKRFKFGGMQVLIDTNKKAAVIPVTISNSYRIVKHNLLPIPWRINVTMRVHPPLWSGSDPQQKVECNQIEAIIRSGK